MPKQRWSSQSPTLTFEASPPRPKKKGAMFSTGTSSGSSIGSIGHYMFKASLPRGFEVGENTISRPRSSRDEVAKGRAAEHSPVFESDDEDEEVSESAIEDDTSDSESWEDSEDEGASYSVSKKEMFQRVDSRPNLMSRRSLITTLMHEPDCAKAPAIAEKLQRHKSMPNMVAPKQPRNTSLTESGDRVDLSGNAVGQTLE